MLDCVSLFVVGGTTMTFAAEISSITCIKAELSEIESLRNDLLWRQCTIQEQLAALESPCPVAATDSEVSWLISKTKKQAGMNKGRVIDWKPKKQWWKLSISNRNWGRLMTELRYLMLCSSEGSNCWKELKHTKDPLTRRWHFWKQPF